MPSSRDASHRVVVERLVEVADAEEQQRVGVRALDAPELLHERRGLRGHASLAASASVARGVGPGRRARRLRRLGAEARRLGAARVRARAGACATSRASSARPSSRASSMRLVAARPPRRRAGGSVEQRAIGGERLGLAALLRPATARRGTPRPSAAAGLARVRARERQRQRRARRAGGRARTRTAPPSSERRPRSRDGPRARRNASRAPA